MACCPAAGAPPLEARAGPAPVSNSGLRDMAADHLTFEKPSDLDFTSASRPIIIPSTSTLRLFLSHILPGRPSHHNNINNYYTAARKTCGATDTKALLVQRTWPVVARTHPEQNKAMMSGTAEGMATAPPPPHGHGTGSNSGGFDLLKRATQRMMAKASPRCVLSFLSSYRHSSLFFHSITTLSTVDNSGVFLPFGSMLFVFAGFATTTSLSGPCHGPDFHVLQCFVDSSILLPLLHVGFLESFQNSAA